MRYMQPTADNVREWETWIAGRPEAIRDTIGRLKLDPWTLYRMRSTGQRVYLLSFFEPDAEGKALCRVAVTGEFNFVTFEREVIGIDPEDLEECDLPGSDEVLGSLAELLSAGKRTT